MITLGVGPTDATDNDGTTTAAVTLVGTTTGRGLIVCVRWLNATATVSSVACSGEAGLTSTPRAFNATSSTSVQWWYLDGPITAGGDKTITVTFSAGTFHVGINAIEVVGADTADIFDASAQANPAASANPSVSLSTAAANAGIFAGVFSNGSNAHTAGSGYTLITFGQTAGSAEGEYDLDAGVAGSKTVDFTASSQSWALSAIALNAQAADPNVTVSPSGVSASGAVGSSTVNAGATVSPTGVSATGQVGDVIAGTVTEVAVTGVSATGNVGTVTAAGGATVAVTGVQATGFVGAESVEFPLVHAIARHIAPVGYAGYLSRHIAPVGYRSLARHRAVWSLMGSQRARHVARYDLMTRGLARHVARYDLSAVNHGLARHRACWSLLSSPVAVTTSRPFLEHDGARLELLDASVSQSEGGAFWSLRARLARPSDYLRLSRLDAIALEIFGDRYELVVETFGRSNANRGVDQQFDVSGRSPLWATLGEPGERVTRTWSAMMARAAVEELAGEAVDWQIVDWQIPSGRLAAVNETAITVIQRIVGAAGGVVESTKDGGLVCRYRYPVTIPQAAGATPNHALTEAVDIYELAERVDERQAFDRVTLTDEASVRGYLSAERDEQQPETILAGESQRFLVFHSPDVAIEDVLISDGELLNLGPASVAVEDEEIVFVNTDTAEVQRIASSSFSYAWFGDGLGVLTVGSDRRKVIAGASGVGVARVSYTAAGRRYAVLSPTSSGGRTEFPIVVYVIGALREDEPSSVSPLRIIVQRGDGAIVGDDIIEPLAGTENVLYVRGRNEIDAAAAKGQVTIRAFYPLEITDAAHFVNGELLVVEDSQLGRAWRGKVKNVEHRIETVDPRTGAMVVSSTIAAERFL